MRKQLGIAVLLAATALVLLPETGFARRGRFWRGGYGYGSMYQGYYPGSYYPGGFISGSYYPSVYYSGSYTTSGYYPGAYNFGSSYPRGYYPGAVYPAGYTTSAPRPTPPYLPPVTGSSPVARQAAYTADSNAAVMKVRVPAPNAKLWVDGEPTTSTGLTRRLVSPPLKPGKDYTYTLKVSWSQDGREQTRTKAVDVHAGSLVDVNLANPVSRPPAGREIVPRKYTEPEK